MAEDKDNTIDKKENADGEKNSSKGKFEKVCMMCRRTESAAGPMIDLMNGMCICHDCMQQGFKTIQNSNLDIASLLKNAPNVQFVDLGALGQPLPEEQQIRSSEGEPLPFTMDDIPAPHKIKAALDQYVIGQEYAKKAISVAVYNHYKRLINEERKAEYEKENPEAAQDPFLMGNDTVEVEKSNILMLGPTGSGKTYLVQTLARILDVPLAMTDATTLTEAGYIGDDIESVVSKLLAAAGNDVTKAEHGIIFIDEIDKIAKKKNANQRDVSGEAVQQGMLKLLEGSVVEVPVGASSKNAMVPMKMIDTRNILFICGGAFPDLEEIVKERLNKHSSIGFHADLKDKYDNEPNLLKEVMTQDLRKYGMIPEFLGRLPIVFALDPLDEDMLVRILKEPRNAIIRQYQELLLMDEVKLTFEDEALRSIAREAIAMDTGARALRAIIERFMLDIMYEIPKDDNIGEVIITKEYIEHTGGPRVLMRGQGSY